MENDTDAEIKYLIKECTKARQSSSCKVLAVAENLLWNAVKRKMKIYESGWTLRTWFHSKFGGCTSEYEIRAAVYSIGEPYCDELFELVDKKQLTLSRASGIVSFAKKCKKDNRVDIDVAFKTVMKKTHNGKKRMRLDKIYFDKHQQVKEKTIPASDTVSLGSRNFREEMKILTKEFVEAETGKADIDPSQRKQLVGEFNIGLEHLLDDLINSTYRSKRGARKYALSMISETAFTNACETIGMFDAEYGKPLDMKRVSRNIRRRSFELHPDRNDEERALAEYQAVQDAREVLNYYSQQVGEKK